MKRQANENVFRGQFEQRKELMLRRIECAVGHVVHQSDCDALARTAQKLRGRLGAQQFRAHGAAIDRIV